MPRVIPYRIELTRTEREELEARARRYTSPYRDVVRAKLVLLAAQGLSNDVIAARLDLPRQVVSKWRKRFWRHRLPGLEELPRLGNLAAHPETGAEFTAEDSTMAEIALIAGIPDMNHSSLPPVLLSEPRALQLAVPPVRNRRQGGLELPALLIPRAPGRATLGYPASETPPLGRSVPHLPPSVPRPLDQVGCHASRSMRPRICPNRCRVKWLSASWRMKYRACRMRRPPVLKSRCWRLVRDQLWMASGRTSRRRRLPRLYAMTPRSNRTSLARNRWQESRVQWVASLLSLIHC